MKVFTTTQELDNAIKELRENAESKTYFRLYLVGENTIRQAVAKYNLIIRYWQGLNGLFRDADNEVQGLSLSSSSAPLEFVHVAIIEGLTDSNCVFVDKIFKYSTDEVLQKLSECGLLENK